MNFPAYIQIISLWVQTNYTYRVELILELVTVLLKVFLLKVVWTAVYAGRGSVDGVPLAEVISFTTLASIQLWAMIPVISGYLHGRIREGLIALDLARPTPFLGQLVAHQIGGTIGVLPFVLLAWPFALFLGGIEPPASPAAAALYVLSLLFAYALTALFGMLMGLLAFWTTEMWGIQAIIDFVAQFFSGAIVPLFFFPSLLRAISAWLPFQGQAYVPLAIYAGRITGQEALGAIGIQAAWVFVLSLAAALLWRRAIRRVVIQGG